jgi:hypothetical protein
MSKLLERTYFALAVIGLLLIWYFNIRFFVSGGTLAPDSFVPSAFANPLTTSITLDVYWAALVFSIWTVAERNKLSSPQPWIYIALCFVVGLAFALPLYLGRQRQLLRVAHPQAPNNSLKPNLLRGSA